MSENLKKAKEIIAKYYDDARCGLFDSRNTAGDSMSCIYRDDNIQIDICYYYEYFEVFGLTDDEFEELSNYYASLKEAVENDR